jgi:hypothetical protein
MGDALRDAMFRAGLAQMLQFRHRADAGYVVNVATGVVRPAPSLSFTDKDRIMLKSFGIKADE